MATRSVRARRDTRRDARGISLSAVALLLWASPALAQEDPVVLDVAENVTWDANVEADVVIVREGVTVTVQGARRVTADRFELEAGAVINGDARGHAAQSGPGAGNGHSSGGSGGGHGGRGGNGSPGGGAFNGSSLRPATVGSGGGTGSSNGYTGRGGTGGGALHLVISGETILNGTIRMRGGNGGASSGRCGGGGAGGAVWIETQSLAGDGALDVRGGNHGCGNGGGGAGGRVAIWSARNEGFGSDQIVIAGGSGRQTGGIGTLAFVDTLHNRLNLFQAFRFQSNDAPFIFTDVTAVATTITSDHSPVVITAGDTFQMVDSAFNNGTNALVLNVGRLESGASTLDAGWLSLSGGALGAASVLDSTTVTLANALTVDVTAPLRMVHGSSIRVTRQTGNFRIRAPELQLDAGSSLNGVAAGYRVNEAPGGQGGGHSSAGGGGGHGGAGGIGRGGGHFDSVFAPVLRGAAGGTGSSNGYTGGGGAGGAALRLEIEGLFEHEGTIDVSGGNGGSSSGRNGGGGAGGSIYVTCGTLRGEGALRAVGGTGPGGAGGGGGGRIAVHYLHNDGFDPARSTVAGGTGGGAGAVGNFVLVDALNNDVLALQGFRFQATDVPYAFRNLFIWDASVLADYSPVDIGIASSFELQDSTWVHGDRRINLDAAEVRMSSSSISARQIYLTGTTPLSSFFDGTTISATHQLDFDFTGPLSLVAGTSVSITNTEERFEVDASRLLIDGTALLASNARGHGAQSGPGAGRGHSSSASGAGYGGAGANGSPAGGATYGSEENPVDWGSGGGTGSSNGYTGGGGRGGGRIKISVQEGFTLDGVVSANGGNGGSSSGRNGGGGSGGSVLMTVGSLTGVGTVRANGGNASGGAGGGGGGRIAIYGRTDGFGGTFQVNGGTGGRVGTVGTVFEGGRPSLTRISPLRGEPGTQVTITGSGFDPVAGNNAVSFNGVAATAAFFNGDGDLVVVVPPGATSGPLRVTVGSRESNGIHFDVIGVLTILSGAFNPLDTTEAGDAAGLEMLQLSLTASAGEDIDVESVAFTYTGSAEEYHVGQSGVRLWQDVDGDGLLDPGDRLLAQTTLPGGPIPMRVNMPVNTRLRAGFTQHWLVTFDLAGSATDGLDFQIGLSSGADVVARGAASDYPIMVIGPPVQGGRKTVGFVGSLSVFTGLRTPPETNESADTLELEVFQLMLHASTSEAVTLQRIVLTAAGSANDLEDIAARGVRLLVDVNENGVLDAADIPIGVDGEYGADNGNLSFDMLETVPAGEAIYWLVVYDLAGSAEPGESFEVRVAASASLTANGDTSFQPTNVRLSGGAVRSRTKTISDSEGSLTFSLGTASPADAVVVNDDSDVPMLQVAVRASSVEDILVDRVTLSSVGSADERIDLRGLGARLYHDINADGRRDAGDLQLGQSRAFVADDGRVSFSGLNHRIVSGTTQNWIVVYDLSGEGQSGRTFSVLFERAEHIVATGDTSSAVIAPGGLPVLGRTVTLGRAGGLTVSRGRADQGPTTEATDALDLEMLQLAFSGGPAGTEAVEITGVTFHASGSGDEVADVVTNSVRLWLDVNRDGLRDAGDLMLGAGSSYPVDNGVITFAGLSRIIEPQQEELWLLTYDLAGAASAGDDFRVSLVEAGDIEARGALTRETILPRGIPVMGGLKTVAEEGSLVFGVGPASRGPLSVEVDAQEVPMLQLELTASSVEEVVLDRLIFSLAGSGDDAAAVQVARLSVDVDGDGQVSPGDRDVAVAQPAGDDGSLTFDGLQERIPAAERVQWLLSYDLSGQGAPGDGFAVSIAGPLQVVATGADSGQAATVRGVPLAGAPLRLVGDTSLAIAAGPNNPRNNQREAADALEVPMLQVDFRNAEASGEAVELISLTVTAAGTGDDVAAFEQNGIFLWHDADRSGSVSPGDLRVARRGFGANDGTVTFDGLGFDIPGGEVLTLLVTANFNGGAQANESFRFSVAQDADVFAQGRVSREAIPVAGAAVTGGTRVIGSVGSLSVFTGLLNPPVATIQNDADEVEMLQISLVASGVEPIRVTRAAFTAEGSGHDVDDLDGARLIRDQNASGRVDAGDAVVGALQSYSADNGRVVFDNLTEVVPAGGRVDWLLVYDFAGSANNGETFRARLAINNDLTAIGSLSGLTANPSGAPVEGAVKTIVAPGALSLAPGVRNPGDGGVLSDGQGVPALQLRLTAGGAGTETVEVTAVTFQLAGSVDDGSDVQRLSLWHDLDRDGEVDDGEPLLGARAPVVDDSTVTFDGLSQTIVGGQEQSWLLTVDLSGSAAAGATFSVSLTGNGAVAARGAVSRLAVDAQGAPIAGGELSVIRPGLLRVEAGAQMPEAGARPRDMASLVLLQVALSAGSAGTESVAVDRLVLSADGSADETLAIANGGLTLYDDLDGDGQIELGEPALAQGVSFDANDGRAVFEAAGAPLAVVEAETTAHWLVAAALSGAGAPGGTLRISVAGAGDVLAEGTASRRPVPIEGPPVEGPEFQLVAPATLSIENGPNSPPPGNEQSAAQGLVMQQLRFTAGPVGTDDVDLLRVLISGRGDGFNEQTNLSPNGAKLWHDENSNGAVDDGEAMLAEASFPADDAKVIFAGLLFTIEAGSFADLLVTYDLSGTAVGGSSFFTELADAVDLDAVGTGSRERVVPAGLPASGAERFIALWGSVAVSPASTDAPLQIVSDAQGVVLSAVRVCAGTFESELVSSVTFTASGTANEATDLDPGSLALVWDENDDGLAAPGEPVLSQGRSFSGDDGTVIFDGLNLFLDPGQCVSWLVRGNLNGNALGGRSFVLGIPQDAHVQGSGLTSFHAADIYGVPMQTAPRSIFAVGDLQVAAGPMMPPAAGFTAGARALPMLQMTLRPGDLGEGVELQSLTFDGAGAGHEVNDIDAGGVRLWSDEDADGSPDAPLGAPASFTGDDGQVTFAGLSLRMDAGQERTLLVTYDVSEGAAPGASFQLTLPDAASVEAVGINTGQRSQVRGTPVQGPLRSLVAPAQLSVSVDPATPADAFGPNLASGILLLALRLEAGAVGSDDTRIDALTLRATGSADESRDLGDPAVQVYRDGDNDGVVSAGDLLVAEGAFAEDDGALLLDGLNATLLSGASERWLVVVNLAGRASEGESFSLSVPAPADIVAAGAGDGAPIEAAGTFPLDGRSYSVDAGAGLQLSLGAANPREATQRADAVSLPVLQLDVTNTGADAATLTELSLDAFGSLDDAVDIAEVLLYRDRDGDGRPTPGDRLLGGAGARFDGDDGSVDFSALGVRVEAGAGVSLLLVYDLAGSAADGASFGAQLSENAQLSALDDASEDVGVFGAPVRSGVQTISSVGTLFVDPGPLPIAQADVPADGEALAALSLVLTASSVEAVSIPALTLRASGSGDDAGNIAGVSIHRDSDGDGVLDPGEPRLAGPVVPDADNGAVTFAGFAQTLAAGVRVHWLVTLDLDGDAAEGDTFRLDLADAADLGAVGETSARPAITLGPPIEGRTLRAVPPRDRDRDGFDATVDCNDDNPDINPGADEVCDGQDNNCADGVDEGLGETRCGVGACEVLVANCQDGQLVLCEPGAPLGEMDATCDGVDDDCDGEADEDYVAGTCGEGECVAPALCVDGAELCDPGTPEEAELCNGLDDDCDGEVPEDELDGDGDGVRGCDGDCDDTLGTVFPDAEEDCFDGVDNNCDGLTDDEAPDCGGDQAPPSIAESANPHATVGQGYIYDEDRAASAAGAPPIRWFATEAPAGFRIDAVSGLVTWVPTEPGEVEITLEATNRFGADSYVFAVTVEDVGDVPPPEALIATTPAPATGSAPLTITFDGSGSFSAPRAPILSYRWVFGDGTPAAFGPVVEHTYQSPGGFVARLTVTNDRGVSASSAVDVFVLEPGAQQRPPIARIDANPRGGQAPLEVRLSCLCSEGDAPIEAYLWELGDGTELSEKEVTHTFAAGTWNVRLTVVDATGLSASDQVTLEVTDAGNRPPVVEVSAEPTRGQAPLMVSFVGAAVDLDGQITSRSWDFGNGTTAEGAEGRTTYREPGVYIAQFCASDDATPSLSGCASLEITATNAAGQVPPRIVSVASAEGCVGEPYGYDADGVPTVRGSRPLRFSLGKTVNNQIEGKPEGAEIDESSGEITWTPTAAQGGEQLLTIVVENDAGSDFQDVLVDVGCVPTTDRPAKSGGGGGCASATPRPGLWLLLGLMVARLWRRRR